MRILFADEIDRSTVAELQEHGHTCTMEAGLGSDDLPDRITGFHALIVRSTRVTRKTIEAADALELIVRAGAGTNTIDTQAAAELGIYVTNVPGRNAIAVAELTIGLLLAIDRRIADNVAALRAGTWNKKEFSRAEGLYGKTLGIVGLGDIGLAVAERCIALGLVVLGLQRPDRRPDREQQIRALGIRLVEDMDQLLASSDIVSLHVPATDHTRGMVDRRFLGLMRPGAVLLNTSRGELLDGPALLEALETRGLRVGLDVFPDEPTTGVAEYDSELARHPNVVGTHHIGASTEQAQLAIARGVVEIIEAFGQGEIVNCVNLAPTRLGTCTLHVRHFDRVGVLASVFDVLRRANLNVEQMENRIFVGGLAAVATIDVVGEVSAELLGSLAALPHVIHVSALPEEAG